MGKRGPMSVVTIPVTTNPLCSTTNAVEEIGGESDRVGIELMLEAINVSLSGVGTGDTGFKRQAAKRFP
jgi:hypothetical protein